MCAVSRKHILGFITILLGLLCLLSGTNWAPISDSNWIPSYIGREYGVAFRWVSADDPLMSLTADKITTPQKLQKAGFTDVPSGGMPSWLNCSVTGTLPLP